MVDFDDSYVPRAPYDHYGHDKPINWSGITRIEKIDVTYAGSDTTDDRDTYELHLYGDTLQVWRFEFDHELRDKVYGLIVHHQHHDLPTY